MQVFAFVGKNLLHSVLLTGDVTKLYLVHEQLYLAPIRLAHYNFFID